MAEKYTKEEWVEKCRLKHNDKYDYSKSEYINNHTKVEIICPKHGIFKQTPKDHLSGRGCPKCKSEKIGEIKRSSTEEFIKKANLVHNSKYDYSKVNYINSRLKIEIICPEHGIFSMTPNNHLKGKGCPKCKGRNLTKEEIIEKFRKIHGNKYDYSLMEYTINHKPIEIICPEHGVFKQCPSAHLRGQGCPKCKMSHLENQVKEILEQLKIEFEYEVNLDGYLKRQSVDFYIPKYKLIIECQGGQHFYAAFNRKDKKRAEEIHRKVLLRDIIKFNMIKEKKLDMLFVANGSDIIDDIFQNEKYNGIYNKKNTVDILKIKEKLVFLTTKID